MTSPKSQSYYIKSGRNSKTISKDIIFHNARISKLDSKDGNIEVYDSEFNLIKSTSGDITIQNSEGGLVGTMSGTLKLRGSNIDRVLLMAGSNESIITSCNIDLLEIYNNEVYLNISTINVIKTDANSIVIPSGNKVDTIIFTNYGKVKVEDGYTINVINGIQVSNQ